MRSIFRAADIFRSEIEMFPIKILSDLRPASTLDRVVTRLRCKFATSADAENAIVMAHFERWKSVMEGELNDHNYADGRVGSAAGKSEFEQFTRSSIDYFAKHPRDLLFPTPGK